MELQKSLLKSPLLFIFVGYILHYMEPEIQPQESQSPVIEVKPNSFDKTKLILPGAILLAAILVSASIVFYSVSSGKLGANIKQAGEKVKVSVDDDPITGNPKAKVTIVEFSDFQCPFCRRFWNDTFSQIKRDYIDTGRVRFVYRDFPLSFHPMSRPSALAAQCAYEQGKFWEMHDKIFGEQEKKDEGTVQFSIQDLKRWASQINLNIIQFNQCLDSEKYKTEVENDIADGSSYGVSGTPTLYINGKSIVGAQPYSVFKEAIEAELR